MTEGERITRETLKAHLYEQTEDGPIFDQGIVDDLARLAEGESQSAIARSLGVTPAPIWKIAHRKQWQHVADE